MNNDLCVNRPTFLEKVFPLETSGTSVITCHGN